MNRLMRMLALTLALLCLYTAGAGIAIAHLLPARLALFNVPRVAGQRLVGPGPPLAAADGDPATAAGTGPATSSGVATQLAGLIGSGRLGTRVGAQVADLATGKVLYALNATTGFAPASTTKLATAVAALDALGPAARFTTSVVRSGGRIVLVGGGDPVLAAGRYPAADYPQPATLASLAAATALALIAKGVTSVRLAYDDSLLHGPALGPGWPNYIATGNVTPISGLEVDQGRLTAAGLPEDSDDPGNYRPRSVTPGLDAAKAFARLLRKNGIAVRGVPTPGAPSQVAARTARLAAVQSPPLAQIVQQMLSESNNVIAETLARQVALATGRPGTFAGGAAAVMAVDGRLGVTGLNLVDGSGLSPLDLVSAQALVTLIRLAAWTGPARLRPAISGLPVAGFSGTLGPGSFFGPFGVAGLGTVRAKTGNIKGVATMAGIAYSRGGQLLAFAFMGNGIARKLGVQPEYALSQLATALAACGCQ